MLSKNSNPLSLNMVFKRYFINLFIFIFFTAIVTAYAVIVTDQQRAKSFSNLIINTTEINKENLREICKLTECSTIRYNGVAYRFDSIDGKPYVCDSATRLKFFIKSNLPNVISIHKDGVDVLIIGNDEQLVAIIWSATKLLMMLSFLFTLVYLFYLKNVTRNTILANKNIQDLLASKLQRTMVESMYHDALGPIVVIKDISNELIPHMENNTISTLGKDNLFLYTNSLTTAVDQLESVLLSLKESKNYSYTNGNKSVYNLITNILATISKFKMDKFNSSILKEELLDTYRLSSMANGELSVVLNNLITNALEAGSTTIMFDANVRKNKVMDIYVIDDGRGVRDLNGKVLSKENYHMIFNKGITTKATNNSVSINEKLTWLQTKFKNYVMGDFITLDSGRGEGLFIIKEKLTKCGGSIELESTASNGSVFKITVPIEKIKKGK